MSQCFEILWWEIFFFLTLLCWLFPNATCIDWCVMLDWILLHFSHRYTDNSMKWKVSGCWKEVIISKAGRSISAFYFWFGQKSEAIADIVSFLLGRDNTGINILWTQHTTPYTLLWKSLPLQQCISLLMCLLFFYMYSLPSLLICFAVRQTVQRQ